MYPVMNSMTLMYPVVEYLSDALQHPVHSKRMNNLDGDDDDGVVDVGVDRMLRAMSYHLARNVPLLLICCYGTILPRNRNWNLFYLY